MSPIYFVHISDSHLGATKEWVSPLSGKNSHERLARVVEAIACLPLRPDFIIHTGDVANDGEESAYRLAAELLGELEIPVYFARGNHDRLAPMCEILPMGPKEFLLSPDEVLCYRFSFGDERFLVLDSQVQCAEAPHLGYLGSAQLDCVEAEIKSTGGWLSLFLHHAPADVDSAWYSERVGMADGDALHSIVRSVHQRVRGVFTGHLHRSLQVHREGIAYVGAPSTAAQFNLWPNTAKADWDEQALPGFHFVALAQDRLVIKAHAIAE